MVVAADEGVGQAREDRQVRTRLTEVQAASLFDEQAFVAGPPENDGKEPGKHGPPG